MATRVKLGQKCIVSKGNAQECPYDGYTAVLLQWGNENDCQIRLVKDALGRDLPGKIVWVRQSTIVPIAQSSRRKSYQTRDEKIASHIDGRDRDDLGESPDY